MSQDDLEFDKIIRKLMKKVRKKQMTETEYRYIASFLGDKNFLVFGTGHDSVLWRYANNKGKTIFLESNNEWIEDDKDTYKVSYSTNIQQADDLLNEFKLSNFTNLEMELPEEVLETKWDIILVDAPEGWADHCPGRMQSLYATYTLASKNTIIFVHDCNRYVEDLYSSVMFSNLEKELTKLRQYRK